MNLKFKYMMATLAVLLVAGMMVLATAMSYQESVKKKDSFIERCISGGGSLKELSNGNHQCIYPQGYDPR